MNQDWQNFLITQGAQIKDGMVSHFGAAGAERLSARDGTVLCDLGQFGVLRVSGEEAQTFLQNLLSNDIREVSLNRAQLSSLNTAKGRLLATLLIWRDGDEYLLQLPRALCDPIHKKLSMYVLRAKVKITDASDGIVSLGISGANAREILRKQFGDLPQENLTLTVRPELVEGENLISERASTGSARTDVLTGSVIKIDDTRFQINTTAQYAPALWAALNLHARPVGSACWNWLNIRSGIPIILPQTQEQFVAQMVNLDLIGGVNFKKGCYPGQEIVARTHYLGKLKRRMFSAHIESTESPQPGDELFSADMEGQSSGMLVDAAPSPVGGHDVLAVVQTSSRETHSVHWKSPTGVALQFLPLPYALPEN